MPRGKVSRKGQAPKNPPLTHFLCLPLVTAESKPKLEASLARFKADVTAVPPTGSAPTSQDASQQRDAASNTSIHPKAIRPAGVLHCTLGVMSLDKARLKQATTLLHSLDTSTLIAPNHPLKISLTGLESMHDPKKTSILYSTPHDASERLYPLCLALQSHFRSAGLLIPDDRPLKLHATVVNTIYAKRASKAPAAKAKLGFSHDGVGVSQAASATSANLGHSDGAAEAGESSSGHGPNANAPLKFDARDLLERYAGFKWAEDVVLDRVAICEMGAKKRFGADGEVVGEEYVEVASVKLPGGVTGER